LYIPGILVYTRYTGIFTVRASLRFSPNSVEESCFSLPRIFDMNQTDKNTLASLRKRADEGEEFNPTLLARFNDLVAQEARSGKRKHHLFIIHRSSPCLLPFPVLY
jgi:hypothetical protein